MKTVFLTIVTTVFVFYFGRAQSYEKRVIKAGESISLPAYYLFPSFTNATVTLSAGQLISKMNYNLLTCTMQFIDNKGDTLNLAHPENVSLITFDSTSFFYKDEGYYQVFTQIDSIKIAVLRKASFDPVRVGAFGTQAGSGAGIASYTSLISSMGERHLTVNEDINVTSQTSYFLILPNGDRLKANKANFIKLFSTHKPSLETFIKENKIDFTKEADLKKLTGFI